MALSNTLYRAWLKRLATGKKATGSLRNVSGGMCCLGHLAKAAGYEFEGSYIIKGYGGTAVLPAPVCSRIGLPDGVQGELSHLNDTTRGFHIVIERIKQLRKAKSL